MQQEISSSTSPQLADTEARPSIGPDTRSQPLDGAATPEWGGRTSPDYVASLMQSASELGLPSSALDAAHAVATEAYPGASFEPPTQDVQLASRQDVEQATRDVHRLLSHGFGNPVTQSELIQLTDTFERLSSADASEVFSSLSTEQVEFWVRETAGGLGGGLHEREAARFNRTMGGALDTTGLLRLADAYASELEPEDSSRLGASVGLYSDSPNRFINAMGSRLAGDPVQDAHTASAIATAISLSSRGINEGLSALGADRLDDVIAGSVQFELESWRGATTYSVRGGSAIGLAGSAQRFVSPSGNEQETLAMRVHAVEGILKVADAIESRTSSSPASIVVGGDQLRDTLLDKASLAIEVDPSGFFERAEQIAQFRNGDALHVPLMREYLAQGRDAELGEILGKALTDNGQETMLGYVELDGGPEYPRAQSAGLIAGSFEKALQAEGGTFANRVTLATNTFQAVAGVLINVDPRFMILGVPAIEAADELSGRVVGSHLSQLQQNARDTVSALYPGGNGGWEGDWDAARSRQSN